MNLKSVGLAIAVVCLMGGCTSSLSVDKLSCEYLTNPAGIDVEHPRFSWIIDAAGERGVYQQAYRVVVSDKADELRNKTGNCWDSGWTDSDNSISVEYAGLPLVGNHAYFWQVGVKVNGSEIWSKPASFRTGLLRQDEWKAQWVSTKEKIMQESPLFRKTFTIGKKVKEAYIYATAAGVYDLYLNGERVGDEVLNPSVSDYRRTVLYSVYDVTTLLHDGTNAFGVMLGNGAYNMQKEEGRYCWDGTQLGNPCFALQMYVTYTDGSNELLTSGEGWKYTAGPVNFNNIYGGEDYNAQKEIEGWATAEIDDSGWKEAAVAPNPGGKVKWQSIPIRITETLPAIASTRPSEKTYLFDLGQNIAGWWRITVKGAAGQTLRIRGAETLNNKRFPKNLEEGDTFSDNADY
ncbi:MAG: family 78 glycoside hydrolase catalytic domain, partial [Bacteroidales bacterium]|nr:family 78 glycoside hydrolase catalytic domain [Bacteroidales bacterium]